MKVSGQAYSKRLASFSTDTLRLISQLNTMDKATALAKIEIIRETDYSEAEVVERLKKLLATTSTETDTAP